MSEGNGSASVPPVSTVARLRHRPDFLHVGRGCRVHLAAFTIQAAQRRPCPPGLAASGLPPACRLGFTVTKKVGGAVERNRIRRRLRAAVREAKALPTRPETDYVVVARREVLTLPFERLIADLQIALRKVGVQMTKPRSSGGTVRLRGKS